MKIAAFNVENLFDRAKAFNMDDTAEGQKIIKAAGELNSLIEFEEYRANELARMRELITILGLAKSDESEFARLRQIRGRLLSRPRNRPFEFEAKGRQDWVGWLELKTAPVNEIAIMNTGRVIRDIDVDILAVVEAENRIVLKEFSDLVVREAGGAPFDECMVIDGNDLRGIDVGLMTKGGYTIGAMRSHVHDLKADGEPVFSRDCPEYAVLTPRGETIWILPNHFKSKFGGDNAASRRKREAQAEKTAEIYERLRAEGHALVAILGDLNDTPNSPPLRRLLAETDLKDVSTHPSFDTGEFAGKGTFGLGNDNQKIDYLLLSPALFARVKKSGLFRKGAFPGKNPPRWTVYPELERDIHAASDHHVIWAEFDE